MASHASGRHRAPGRYNPVSEISRHRGESRPACRQDLCRHRRLRWSRGLVRPPGLGCPGRPAGRAKAATDCRPASPSRPPRPQPRRPPTPSASSASRRPPSPSPSRSPSSSRAPWPATARSRCDREPLDGPHRAHQQLKPAAGGVLGIAAQYEGIMYSYGGTTPAPASTAPASPPTCSARSASACRARPRQQRQAATPVSNPQPGDLVFFGSPGLPRGHLRRERHDVGLPAQRQGRRAPLDLVLQRHLRPPLTRGRPSRGQQPRSAGPLRFGGRGPACVCSAAWRAASAASASACGMAGWPCGTRPPGDTATGGRVWMET